MSRDVRIYDESELSEIYQSLNTVRVWLEGIELSGEIKTKINQEYLKDAISLTKKVRDTF